VFRIQQAEGEYKNNGLAMELPLMSSGSIVGHHNSMSQAQMIEG